MGAGLKRMFMRRNTRIRRAIILAKASLAKFDESGKSSPGKVSSCGIREITMITTFVRCKRKKQLSKMRDVRLRRCDLKMSAFSEKLRRRKDDKLLKSKNTSRSGSPKTAEDNLSRSGRRQNRNDANWRIFEIESAKRFSKKNRGSKRSNGVGRKKKRRRQQLENGFRISDRAWAAKH